jgi:hypothetical protein
VIITLFIPYEKWASRKSKPFKAHLLTACDLTLDISVNRILLVVMARSATQSDSPVTRFRPWVMIQPWAVSYISPSCSQSMSVKSNRVSCRPAHSFDWLRATREQTGADRESCRNVNTYSWTWSYSFCSVLCRNIEGFKGRFTLWTRYSLNWDFL